MYVLYIVHKSSNITRLKLPGKVPLLFLFYIATPLHVYVHCTCTLKMYGMNTIVYIYLETQWIDGATFPLSNIYSACILSDTVPRMTFIN